MKTPLAEAAVRAAGDIARAWHDRIVKRGLIEETDTGIKLTDAGRAAVKRITEDRQLPADADEAFLFFVLAEVVKQREGGDD